MASIQAIRARVESSLAGRIAAPFAYRDRRIADTVSCGIPEIDALTGGLPRGALTEICGAPCSGRTSLLLASLAARTAEGEACTLVDGRDSFDPASAEAAGVRLGQLLWVRCRDIEQSLRATDLLVRAGGFGLIAIDLADIEPKTVRGVTLNTWFRFRRAVEDTPSILLLIAQESNAKTCASLVMRLESDSAYWLSTQENLQKQLSLDEMPQGPLLQNRTGALSYSNLDFNTWTSLLGGYGVRAETLHARIQPAKEIAFIGAPPKKSDGSSGRSASFETRMDWRMRSA
jgi:hypothetical protein